MNPNKLLRLLNLVSNNSKETKGRGVRKQYVPAYPTDEKKREELTSKWKAEGVSLIEIARRFRQKKTILHEIA